MVVVDGAAQQVAAHRRVAFEPDVEDHCALDGDTVRDLVGDEHVDRVMA